MSKQPPKYWGAINTRRCDLIERDIDGEITEAEQLELGMLQQWCDILVQTYAPYPDLSGVLKDIEAKYGQAGDQP